MDRPTNLANLANCVIGVNDANGANDVRPLAARPPKGVYFASPQKLAFVVFVGFVCGDYGQHLPATP